MSSLAPVNNFSLINDIGFLKLKLVISGLFVDQALAKTLSEHSLAGWVDLILPGEVWVRAPFKVNAGEHDSGRDSIVLLNENNIYFIDYKRSRIPVQIPEIPTFYKKSTLSGKSMASVGVAYAGYLAIAPTSACTEWGHLLQCRYCAYGLDASLAVDIPSVDDVVETVGEAISEGHVKHVHLYFGYYDQEDGGASFFAPYISAIKKKYDVLISAQATPPYEISWIDHLYALGVDSIAYNLEIYDTEVLKTVSPQSASLINRSKYLNALKHAARIFPGGTVTSELLVGLEPMESTKAGIDFLLSIGVLPTLAILQPGEGCGRKADLPEATELMPLFEYLSKSISKGNFSRRWVDHFNILMDVGPESFAARKKYSALLSKKFGPALSKIRRVIRVKEADK